MYAYHLLQADMYDTESALSLGFKRHLVKLQKTYLHCPFVGQVLPGMGFWAPL